MELSKEKITTAINQLTEMAKKMGYSDSKLEKLNEGIKELSKFDKFSESKKRISGQIESFYKTLSNKEIVLESRDELNALIGGYIGEIRESFIELSDKQIISFGFLDFVSREIEEALKSKSSDVEGVRRRLQLLLLGLKNKVIE